MLTGIESQKAMEKEKQEGAYEICTRTLIYVCRDLKNALG